VGHKQLFDTAGALTSSEVPVDVRALAGALSERHGDVLVARESSGTHLYMACPDCLEREGDKELKSRHLALNAEKYLVQGKWAKHAGTYDPERSAVCMKTDTPYKVEDLLDWLPLAGRGISVSRAGKVTSSVNMDRLVPDGKGNMVPEGPGACIPVPCLPPGHHAAAYLENRGFDRKVLWDMFRCSYCVKEAPEDRDKGRFYKRMPCGFKDTPQGRIIFYADMYGVQRSWQARIIDKVEGNRKFFWHPYENRWFQVYSRESEESRWELYGSFRDEVSPWNPAKYKTATGASRNSTLMCLDAAIRWNEGQGRTYRQSMAFLCEGPLDAGKLMPPAIPLTGKFLSSAQAEMLAKHFRHLFYLYDNDEPGRKAVEKAARVAKPLCEFTPVELPGAWEGMDPGDLTYGDAGKLTAKYKGMVLG
jgi:hypothetical protein